MFKFQWKITILNFLTCANLHMIEKPLRNLDSCVKHLAQKSETLTK